MGMAQLETVGFTLFGNTL